MQDCGNPNGLVMELPECYKKSFLSATSKNYAHCSFYRAFCNNLVKYIHIFYDYIIDKNVITPMPVKHPEAIRYV